MSSVWILERVFMLSKPVPHAGLAQHTQDNQKVRMMMAVFYDTGDGDFYGGPTKEAVVAEIIQDFGDIEYEKIKHTLREVPGTTKMAMTDENEEPTGESTTLEAEYEECLGTYCVATTNN